MCLCEYSEIVAVNVCVCRPYVSKKALGTSIQNTFELHLSEHGLYRKNRYMRRNQPKFGVYPDVARTIFGVFSVNITHCQTAKIVCVFAIGAVPIHDVATREKHLLGSELIEECIFT